MDSSCIYCAISSKWCTFCTKLHRFRRICSKHPPILHYNIFYCQDQGPHSLKRCLRCFFFIFDFKILFCVLLTFSKTIYTLFYSIVSQPNNIIKTANTFLSSSYFRWFMQNLLFDEIKTCLNLTTPKKDEKFE